MRAGKVWKYNDQHQRQDQKADDLISRFCPFRVKTAHGDGLASQFRKDHLDELEDVKRHDANHCDEEDIGKVSNDVIPHYPQRGQHIGNENLRIAACPWKKAKN